MVFQHDWVDRAKVLKEFFLFICLFLFSPRGEQASFAEAAARQQAVTEMHKPVPHFSNLVPDIILCPPCKSLSVDTAPSLFLHWPFIRQEMFNKSYWVPVGVGYPSGSWLQRDRQDPRLPDRGTERKPGNDGQLVRTCVLSRGRLCDTLD